MKKPRLLALVLVLALVLPGCTSMLERSYSSSSLHVDYSVTEDTSILRAESYQALVNSILYFVGEHVGSGTIRLYNYKGNVDADLDRACSEVMTEDPLGAFAVRSIDYESTRILTYHEVKFRIVYQRTASEVASIRSVSGQAGIWQELDRIAGNRQSYAALRTAYFPGDAQLVSHLFWLSFYNTPTVALEAPELTVAFYPEEGTQRILEAAVNWHVSLEELTKYKTELSQAATQLIAEYPATDISYTIQELATILRDTVTYDPSGDHTALAAIQGEPVNDLGVLLALEFLCQHQDMEVSVAADTSGAQFWLIVSTPSGYRHLLPRDLRPTVSPAPDFDPDMQPDSDPDTVTDTESSATPVEDTETWQLPLYTDEELAALGFDWPRELHPACVDYSGTIPE